MESSITTIILNILLAVTFLSIALRAFFLYAQLRSPRLFLLGLSMSIIALTAAADFTAGIITSIQLNVDWFLYLGQTMSFLFIFLSLLFLSTTLLRRLMLWHALTSAILLFLLFLAPILPEFHNSLLQFLLSGSRCLVCFMIFGYYSSAFFTKETRFSFLIGSAFFLLSLGYSLILPKIFTTQVAFLDPLGDIIRIAGVLMLLTAYIIG